MKSSSRVQFRFLGRSRQPDPQEDVQGGEGRQEGEDGERDQRGMGTRIREGTHSHKAKNNA